MNLKFFTPIVSSRRIKLIGSLSNYGDSSEDITKQYALKQWLFTCVSSFCTFLRRPRPKKKRENTKFNDLWRT